MYSFTKPDRGPTMCRYCTRCQRQKNEQDTGHCENNVCCDGAGSCQASTVRAPVIEASILAWGLRLKEKSFSRSFPHWDWKEGNFLPGRQEKENENRSLPPSRTTACK